MKLCFHLFASAVVAAGLFTKSRAQIPFEPAQELAAPAPAAPSTLPAQAASQKQADVDWLTSYMLAFEGYHFDRMPALEKSFEKMTATQLHMLRQFYERKHAMQMRQAAAMRQLQALQLSRASAFLPQQQTQQPQQPLHQDQPELPPDQQVHIRLPSEPTDVNIGEIRLQQMQAEAAANRKGELFEGRDPDAYGANPFGVMNGRGVVAGDDDEDDGEDSAP